LLLAHRDSSIESGVADVPVGLGHMLPASCVLGTLMWVRGTNSASWAELLVTVVASVVVMAGAGYSRARKQLEVGGDSTNALVTGAAAVVKISPATVTKVLAERPELAAGAPTLAGARQLAHALNLLETTPPPRAFAPPTAAPAPAVEATAEEDKCVATFTNLRPRCPRAAAVSHPHPLSSSNNLGMGAWKRPSASSGGSWATARCCRSHRAAAAQA
jgi:hypothetical protein